MVASSVLRIGIHSEGHMNELWLLRSVRLADSLMRLLDVTYCRVRLCAAAAGTEDSPTGTEYLEGGGSDFGV